MIPDTLATYIILDPSSPVAAVISYQGIWGSVLLSLALIAGIAKVVKAFRPSNPEKVHTEEVCWYHKRFGKTNERRGCGCPLDTERARE